MTYAPPRLIALMQFMSAHDVINLGIVGDTAHAATGTSYHLGKSQLAADAYSIAYPRDKAGLTEAASAVDLGKFAGSFTGLRSFSVWLVARCKAGDPGTDDIREVIFSPDGRIVQRWDNYAKKLYLGGTGTGQGDNSHLYHTHISFPRDSEFRDKIALIGLYFGASPAVPKEDNVNLNRIVSQNWTANGTNGVLRAAPVRGGPVIATLPAGTLVESEGEYFDIAGTSWRVIEYPKGSGTPAYFIRYSPIGPVPKDNDFVAGALVVPVDVTSIAAKAIADFKIRINSLS